MDLSKADRELVIDFVTESIAYVKHRVESGDYPPEVAELFVASNKRIMELLKRQQAARVTGGLLPFTSYVLGP